MKINNIVLFLLRKYRKLSSYMKKKIVLLVFLSISIVVLGQFNSKLCPKNSGDIVRHQYYMLSYNEEMEQANWVFYALYPELIKGDTKRSNKFKEDKSVSSQSASLSDYKDSGYDRGHLCPAAAMCMNKRSMDESFLMSNMSPQLPSFNRGIWKKLESYVRKSIIQDTIYVVTGPIFEDNITRIGNNQVCVPGYYYKVIYRPSKSKMEAYILPNKKSSLNLSHFKVSVDDVEIRTGIDFFYKLEDTLEIQLENQK